MTLGCAGAAPAVAVDAHDASSAAEILRTFDIPAQPANAALNEFAKQADITLVFSSDVVSGTQTRALKGRYPIPQALEQLLKGTRLSFQRLSQKTIAVSASTGEVRANPPAQTPAAVAEVAGEPLDEVLVTAQRRAERLRDVPISITVLDGTRLDESSFTSVREALNAVAGVSIITNQNDNPQLTVRGVSAAVTRFAGSSVAGYYLDTVPFALISSAITPDSSAYDLERVEVLRGPQGTLYGASSLNGVLRILTHDADLDRRELKARATTSSTEDGGWNYRGDAALNLPLVEGKLAARLVAGYQDESGWIDRPHRPDANRAVQRNLRLKIYAQPTAALSLGFTAWISRIDRDATSVDSGGSRSPIFIDEPTSDDYDAYGIKVAYEFPLFTLTSMTSHIEAVSTSNLAVANFPVDPTFITPLHTVLEGSVFAQETTLTSSSSGGWRWSVGALYRDAHDDLLQWYQEYDITLSDRDETSESYAVYGELTRVLAGGAFELTGGLRYFKDDVGIDDRPSGTAPRDTFSATSPRAVLTWLPNDSLRVYASYAEGFRSGVHQPSAVIPLGIPPADPDTLTNYELGAKGNLRNGDFAFDAALYYIDWKKLQLAQFVNAGANGIPVGSLATLNGDSASGLGFDFAMTARPVQPLTVGITFSWNDLTFDADTFSGQVRYAARGDRLNFSPEFTYGVFGSYGVYFGNSGYKGTLSLSASHIAEQLGRGAVGQVGGSDPFTTARASFTLSAPRRWSAMLFVDNATNENGNLLPTPGPVTADLVEYWNSRLRPRTVGLQLDYQLDSGP